MAVDFSMTNPKLLKDGTAVPPESKWGLDLHRGLLADKIRKGTCNG